MSRVMLGAFAVLISVGVAHAADSVPDSDGAALKQVSVAESRSVDILRQGASDGSSTVRTHLRVQGEPAEIEKLWLAEISVVDGDAPWGLALTWSEVPAGWFGDAWTVQLESGRALLPESSQSDLGGDPIARMDLATVTPRRGHMYESVLSYDPGSGAVSIIVTDLTEGQRVVQEGLYVHAVDQPVSVGANLRVHADLQSVVAIESVEAFDGFVPMGLQWRFVRLGDSGATSPLIGLDRREDAGVAMDLPWSNIPGAIRLSVGDQVVLEHDLESLAAGDHLFPISVARMPAGNRRAVLQYVDGDRVWDLSGIDIVVGRVIARVDNVRVTGIDSASYRIEGDVIFETDGEIHGLTVGLEAVVFASGLTIDEDVNVARITQDRLRAIPMMEASLDLMGRRTAVLPFSRVVLLPQVDAAPPVTLRIRLLPYVEPEVLTQRMEYDQLIRPPRDSSNADRSPRDGRLRVMTYNIRHGMGMDDAIDLERIAEVIGLADADIVGLNEVDIMTRRSGDVDQAGTLADLTGMHVAYGANFPYQGGEFGNAILSRNPIESVERIPLPNAEGGRPRGVMHAQVDRDGTTVHVFVAHLALDHEEHWPQLQRIAEIIEGISGPVILMGDLNMIAGTETEPAKLLTPMMKDAWTETVRLSDPGDGAAADRLRRAGNTFRSDNPTRRIDYVFFSGPLQLDGAHAVMTIDSFASDHRPVVAALVLDSEATGPPAD